MKEYWVEYDWEECFGRKLPNSIRCFKTEAEANEFVKTTADGRIIEVTMTEC